MAEQHVEEDKGKECYFFKIPVEVTEKILTYLSPYGELQQAKCVCKTWHELVTRICVQRRRCLYESVCRGTLHLRAVPHTSRITPLPRFSHSSCVVGRCMYVFGGCSSSNTSFNDVYELDLLDYKWTRLRLSGVPPPPKECASAVVHEKKIIAFGGWCQPSRLGIVSNARFHNSVHVLDVAKLTWVTPFTAKDWPQPCERAGHAACVVQDQMVVFGGAQRQTRYNDVWMLDLNLMCWTMPAITGKRPDGRFGHSQMMINPHTVLILGGCGGPNVLFNDVWLLHLKTMTWTEVQVTNTELEAPQLWSHPAVNILDRIVVFSCPRRQGIAEGHEAGQRSLHSNHMQTYTLNCEHIMTEGCCEWQQIVGANKTPPATTLHSVVTGRGEIIIFGGFYRLNNSQKAVNTLVRVTPSM